MTKHSVWRKEGANPESIEQLLAYEPHCPICFSHIANRLDHDHSQKYPRGILCDRCNKLLGFAKDSIEILENAARYLRVSRRMRVKDYQGIILGPCIELPDGWVEKKYVVILRPKQKARTEEWPVSLTARLDRKVSRLAPTPTEGTLEQEVTE